MDSSLARDRERHYPFHRPKFARWLLWLAGKFKGTRLAVQQQCSFGILGIVGICGTPASNAEPESMTTTKRFRWPASLHSFAHSPIAKENLVHAYARFDLEP
jgi:hypothetical protein